MVQKPRWDKLISIILLLNEKHRLFEVNCILWDHFQPTKINSCCHILLKTNNTFHWDQNIFWLKPKILFIKVQIISLIPLRWRLCGRAGCCWGCWRFPQGYRRVLKLHFRIICYFSYLPWVDESALNKFFRFRLVWTFLSTSSAGSEIVDQNLKIPLNCVGFYFFAIQMAALSLFFWFYVANTRTAEKESASYEM